MTLRRGLVVVLLLATLVWSASAPAQAKVVNENEDRLPPGCDSIAEEAHITVRGGRQHAADLPGVVYTFDNHTWSFPACTKLTITFINDDEVRHQFMPHGAWPNGFFLIEVDGGEQETGTFILGSEPNSLMVHCGLPQHQQKGMKAQILVAGGIGDIPNVPTVSGIPSGDGHGSGSGDEAGILGLRTVPELPVASLLALGAAGLLRRRR